MKKLLVVFFLFPLLSYGQSSVSLKAGLISGKFNKTYDGSINERQKKFNIGFIYTYTLKKIQFSLESSIMTKEGTSIYPYDYYGQPAIATFDYNYKVLNLPIMISWIPLNKKVIVGITTGMAPAILLSAQGIYTDPNNFPSPVKDKLLNPQRVMLDYVAGIKGGIFINQHLFVLLHARYGTSLGFHSPALQVLPGITVYDSRGMFNYFNSFIEIGYRF